LNAVLEILNAASSAPRRDRVEELMRRFPDRKQA
jgi:hypothetical protein